MDTKLSVTGAKKFQRKASGLGNEGTPIGNEESTNKAKNGNKKRNKNRNRNKKTETKEQNEPKPVTGGRSESREISSEKQKAEKQ